MNHVPRVEHMPKRTAMQTAGARPAPLEIMGEGYMLASGGVAE